MLVLVHRYQGRRKLRTSPTPVLRQSDLDELVAAALCPLYPPICCFCFYSFYAIEIDCDGRYAMNVLVIGIGYGYCGRRVGNWIATSSYCSPDFDFVLLPSRLWIETVPDGLLLLVHGTAIFFRFLSCTHHHAFCCPAFDCDCETSCGTPSFSTRSFSENATTFLSWCASRLLRHGPNSSC